MAQEDKELLIKDICARLPYNVKVERQNCFDSNKIEIENISEIVSRNFYEDFVKIIDNLHLKPYLRPISSMTDEEENEYNSLNGYEKGVFPNTEEAFDWLNEHHFDYRGLIEKGLAIAVTEDNNLYKIG